MLPYLTRRLLAFIPVLWAAVTLVFIALRLTPGAPTETLYAEALIPPEQVAANRAALGLDRPLLEQYAAFVGQLARGQFGASIFTGRSVVITISEMLGPTAQLASTGLALGLLFGLALGLIAATTRLGGRAAQFAIALSQALPVAWTGLLILWLGTGLLRLSSALLVSLALPALVLAIAVAGPIAQITRASLSASQNAPYLLAARARGIPEGWPVMRHALRASVVPIVNMAALQAAFLFGGTVITETVFARPGLGRLLVDSLLRKDFPVVQGIVLVVAGLYLAFNLAADLAAAALDPRLRAQWH